MPFIGLICNGYSYFGGWLSWHRCGFRTFFFHLLEKLLPSSREPDSPKREQFSASIPNKINSFLVVPERMPHDDTSFLGIGWSFPPQFDQQAGGVMMQTGEPDIQGSLQILLSTGLGERVMQPLFGCNMDQLVFELLDTTLKTEMKNLIQKAILLYEPRIKTEKIDIESNEFNGVIWITVHYLIKSTNTRGNLVYPFYLSEK